MGRELYKIKAGLIELVRSVIGDLVLSGEVSAVDDAAYTCDVTTENGMELYGVQLTALKESGKGCVIIPKIGTTIQMLNIGDDYLAIAVEEADKVIQLVDTGIKTITKKLEIEAEETIYNGGKNGGVPIAGNVVERLNNLEQFVSDLAADHKSHTHSTSQGPSGTLIKPFAKSAPAKTKAEDIENPKVKH